MSTLYSDSFSGNLTAYDQWDGNVANSGGPYYTIASGALQVVANGTSAPLVLSVKTSSLAAFANGQVTVTVKNPSSTWDGGPVIRMVDGLTMYALDVYNSGGWRADLTLYSGSGAGTALASNTTIAAPVDGDKLTIKANGTTLTGYINGVQVVTVTNSTIANGQPAIHWWGSPQTVAFDDFLVEDLASATVNQADFLFRNDDGSESAATAVTTQNTNATIPAGTAFRLRTAIVGVDAASVVPQIEFKKSTDSTFTAIKASGLASNIASVGTLGTGVSSTSSTTLALTTTTNGLAVGDYAIVTISAANTSTTDGDNGEVSSVTDSVGNTWTKLGEQTNSNAAAAGGVTCSVWYSRVTVAAAVGTVITANFGTARVDKCISGWKFTSPKKLILSATAVANVTDGGSGFGSVSFSGLASKQRVYFRALAKKANSTTAITASTNFTTQGITIRSRNSTSAVILRGEFRVNASTGETSNPTLAVTGDTAAVFVAMEEQEYPITLSISSNISAGGTQATAYGPMAAPSGYTSSNFSAGNISDDTNPLASKSLTAGSYTEYEFSLVPTSGVVVNGDSYQFRITNSGTALTNYSTTPTLTIGTPASDVTASATLTGTATTSIAKLTFAQGASTLAGAATTSFTGRACLMGAATLTGVAATSIVGGIYARGAATLTGLASTAFSSSSAFLAGATLTGVATTAIARTVFASAASTLAGLASTTFSGASYPMAAATLSGAAATNFASSVSVSAAASLAGTAATAFSGFSHVGGAASLTGSANTSLTPVVVVVASATLVGSADDSFNTGAETTASIALTGSAETSLIPTVYLTASVSLIGTAATSIAARTNVAGAATLTGTASSLLSPRVSVPAAATLTGVAATSFVGKSFVLSAATLVGTASLSFSPTTSLTGAASLLGQAATSLTKTIAVGASASLSSTASTLFLQTVSVPAAASVGGAADTSPLIYLVYAGATSTLTGSASTVVQPITFLAGAATLTGATDTSLHRKRFDLVFADYEDAILEPLLPISDGVYVLNIDVAGADLTQVLVCDPAADVPNPSVVGADVHNQSVTQADVSGQMTASPADIPVPLTMVEFDFLIDK